MQQLKCSSRTRLPTSCVARSYCLSFSGAFMALVYSPYSFSEIGVVLQDRLRHRSPQRLQFLFRRRQGERHIGRRVEIEARDGTNVGPLVPAFQAEAALVLLPSK